MAFDTSMDYGTPFDSIRKMIIPGGNTAIQYESEMQTPGSITATSTIYIIEKKEHLFEALNISMAASFSGFVYSGSARAEYASSLEINQSSLYCVIDFTAIGKTDFYPGRHCSSRRNYR